MLRTTALIALMLLASVSEAAKSHGDHGGSQGSLLEACQDTAALASPHCGRVPGAVFHDDQLFVVFSQHGHIYLSKSEDQGLSYGVPVVVNRTPEQIYDDGENRPKIKIGTKGEIYVSWTHKTPGRYSGDVRFSRSLDGGKTFDEPLTVNSDHALIGHRFEAMSLDQQGRIYLIWIDKRDRAAAAKNNQDYSGASLYYAVSDDAGNSFQANRKLVDHSCECCRIASDIDQSGKVVALWRHVYPGDTRDHAISYVLPDMPAIEGWPLKASDDDWQIEGCPHHGPDMSIDKDNQAHMAWFTQGEKQKGLIYGRYNFEKQQTELVMTIDDSPSASRPQVQVMGDQVYLMWKRFNGQNVELLIKRSTDAGISWTDAEAIASTENNSDHPDWVLDGDRLFASWHTQSEGLMMIPVLK